MNLNPQQQQAVEHSIGPLLIIAGAGSGKTRVLTERLARIIESNQARAEQILTVTFTNKAASEIKHRALDRLNQNTTGAKIRNIPWMGTFHSIAVRILRRDIHHLGINNQFTVYDADDQLNLVKKVMKQLDISTKNFNPRSVHSAISGAKNQLIDPEDYYAGAQGYFQETVAQVYKAYQKEMLENVALDFDDLLFNTVRLLQQQEQVQKYYQHLFQYIMVDEYQDTNHAQYKMINLLSAPQHNIAVVGDDDQSIYGWRGATVRNILEFERDYSNVTVIKLEQNYRSTKKILEASNSIVKSMDKRRSKNLWTDNDTGENAVIYEALDEKDEAYWAAETIAELIDSGVPASQIAILYRINAQSRVLEEALLKGVIPYKIVGNVRFYERKEIKDILAYLKILYNPLDTLSLLRIINVPSRKIGAKTIADLLEKAEQAEMDPLEYLLAQKSLLKGSLANFATIVEDLRAYADNGNITGLINYTAERTGYIEMLDDGTEDGKQRIENIKELISVASKYQEMSPQASLQAFLEEVALTENTSASNEEIAAEDKVTLMTVHSAKGLEFEHVLVTGMEEGLFPHSRSFASPTELDEERRLAYVAITRAKKRVYMSYAISRTVFGSRQSTVPSRFLSDIDSDLVDFQTFSHSYSDDGDLTWMKNNNSNNIDNEDADEGDFKEEFNVEAGDRVIHPQFGKGRVISIDYDTVVVEFETNGSKELATEFANLAKV
jgi:DNA helicase-2/ATP-dependent DNA helicase PcrA